ncbi:Tm-1-like ATP-binding domain-containing protein [Dermabacter hominis]|uniref:Tm-1-like ATP-binding domain-containing protein n=1 Tax=Dermabacter hominis TaxID=36740 RepID=UPI00316AC168|nr:Tm-1-like ATP-binding domain-containing protein [Dermabacter hominis]
MTTIALVGTLDTKAEDYAWLKEHLAELGVGVLAVDVGSFSTADFADVSSDEVIDAAGEDAAKLRERRDRGEMMAVMGRGAAKIVQKLAEEGRIHGILAVGGSGGSSVAAPAMQAVPVGFPKLLVSTMASGDVSPYVGETDTTIMYSVVDVAGVNRISAMVLGNAAAGIAGMAKAYEARLTSTSRAHRPLVGLSMFGLTTPTADEARKTLTELGYEVLVFHATGAGGRAMEKLIESGLLAGVCDLTTTELADDLVGGVLSAGPERLEMAGRMGTPQVVSLGALDMVNFGPKDTVSSKFDGRTFVVHNPTVTLMRTSRSETEELGRRIGTKLAAATGPSELFIPTNGLSGIDVEGGPFYDPEADAALFDAVKTNLEGSGVPIHEHECAVNDEGFGRAMAERLHELIRNQSGKKEN